ncbi:LysO family transporter [Salinivirga cyanobacteriivorans]
MVAVLVIMTAGALLGYFLRNKPKIVMINDKLIMLAVFGLLFLMGVAIGSNPTIIQKLPVLGAQAMLIAVVGIAGSVVAGSVVYYFFFRKKY